MTKKKNTFSVLFYLKKTVAKRTGEVPIMTRITVNGRLCQFATKLYVIPLYWDQKAQKSIGKSSSSVNPTIEGIKASLFAIYNRLRYNGHYVTVEKIRDEFFGCSNTTETILSYSLKLIDEVKKQVGVTKSSTTYSKYQINHRRLNEFIQSYHQGTDIPLRELTYSFISEFEVFLLTDCHYCRNSAGKILYYLKKIVNMAYAEAIIPKNIFAPFKVKSEHVARGYLTEEEIKTILLNDLVSERLEHARDLFIFACFTGLSYVDMNGLRQEHIQKVSDGELWIKTERQKTGISVNIPLLEIPKMILEKYHGKLEACKILPTMSNQKLNAYLKEIADVCGIQKNLTFHLARHTFATSITLSKGVPIETISRMLGHTNITTTQLYARLTNAKISNDMKCLNSEFEDLRKYLRKEKEDK